MTNEELQEHIRTTHAKSILHECTKCNYKTANLLEYKEHFAAQHETKRKRSLSEKDDTDESTNEPPAKQQPHVSLPSAFKFKIRTCKQVMFDPNIKQNSQNRSKLFKNNQHLMLDKKHNHILLVLEVQSFKYIFNYIF